MRVCQAVKKAPAKASAFFGGKPLCTAGGLGDGEKIMGGCLRGGLHIPGDPPFNSLREAANQVVEEKVLWDLLCENRCVAGEQLRKILLKIHHKQAVAVGCQDSPDVHLVFLQMIQNMAQLQLQVPVVQSSLLLGEQVREHMVEDIVAQAVKQSVLGFKVGIKGAASDIGCVDDLLNGDGGVLLLLGGLALHCAAAQQNCQQEQQRQCFFHFPLNFGESEGVNEAEYLYNRANISAKEGES